MNLSMNHHKEDTQFVAGIITVNKHPEMPQYMSSQVNNSTVFWAPFPQPIRSTPRESTCSPRYQRTIHASAHCRHTTAVGLQLFRAKLLAICHCITVTRHRDNQQVSYMSRHRHHRHNHHSRSQRWNC